MFVRKKRIKGNDYYYLVRSVRIKGKVKKSERYIGLNKPSAEEIKKYEKEFDSIKYFLSSKKDILNKIKKDYNEKIKKSTKDQIYRYEEDLIIEFTYDTSRIEGSTLTYKDTKMLLKEGISPREKPIRDIKESENHKKAYLYMKDNLKKDMTKDLILKLHKILKKDITEDAGKFRDAQVRVSNLIPINHKMLDKEVSNLIKWYKKSKVHPLETAAVFHSIFERLHPFFDGNGRVGRILLNYILLKKDYPAVIIRNKNKRRYYNALQKADGGNYLYMIKYLFSELISRKGL